MKDIYRRNKLQPLESNFVKIHNCKSDDPDDNEAAFAILLNKDRKQEYDKVYNTLKTIGRLRHHFNLNTSGGWHNKYADFVYTPEKPQHTNRSAPLTAKVADKIPLDKKWRYYALAGLAALVIGLGYSFNAPDEKASGEVLSADGKSVLKHAVADNTPIYDAPSESANIVAKLDLFQDIQVLKGGGNNGWEVIERGETQAYIRADNLANGSGYPSYLQHCQSSPMAKPAHGEALFATSTGPHSLVVVNPPGKDAVVKLKDTRNQDVLIYYVEGGKTLTVDTIPDGRYSFWYAVGDNYNFGCGHFIDNVQAWREQETVNFQSRMEGQLQYNTSHVLSLKNPLADARSIDPRYF